MIKYLREARMAGVQDAREAEEIVQSYYYDRNPLGPQPYSFMTHKQGYTWIVRFSLKTLYGEKECEWPLKDNGEVVSRY